MAEEYISQLFRWKQETRNETKRYFDDEIDQNELMCKKHKKVCMTLIYTEHFLIFLKLLDVFQFLLLLPYLVVL